MQTTVLGAMCASYHTYDTTKISVLQNEDSTTIFTYLETQFIHLEIAANSVVTAVMAVRRIILLSAIIAESALSQYDVVARLKSGWTTVPI